MNNDQSSFLNIPKSVPNKSRRIIQFWDDERRIGNSLIVSLKTGFKFNHDIHNKSATHVMGFDTVKEAVNELRECITCSCSQCTSN